MRKRKNIKKKKKPCEANWFFEKTHIIVAYKFDQEEKQEKLPNYQLWNYKRDKISKCCSDILKDCKIISILVMDKIDFLGSNLWS